MRESSRSPEWRNVSLRIGAIDTPPASTASLTCGGKGRRVVVKMTSFGAFWHTGVLVPAVAGTLALSPPLRNAAA